MTKKRMLLNSSDLEFAKWLESGNWSILEAYFHEQPKVIKIVKLRLFGNNGHPMTFKRVAEEIGLSRNSVYNWYYRAGWIGRTYYQNKRKPEGILKLRLKRRIYNCLIAAGISEIEHITRERLLDIKVLGKHDYEEIRNRLKEIGIDIRPRETEEDIQQQQKQKVKTKIEKLSIMINKRRSRIEAIQKEIADYEAQIELLKQTYNC